MRNFNYDDQDDFEKDEIDNLFSSDMTEGDFEELDEDDDEDMFLFNHIDLIAAFLNQKMFSMAISIAEKSIFWRFKTNKAKMRAILKAYNSIIFVLDNKEVE